jgi:hypothetical protein
MAKWPILLRKHGSCDQKTTRRNSLFSGDSKAGILGVGRREREGYVVRGARTESALANCV